MNLERRILELERKADTDKRSEAIFISWEGNEGCNGRRDTSLCPYRKASGGVIWLPCGDGCDGIKVNLAVNVQAYDLGTIRAQIGK